MISVPPDGQTCGHILLLCPYGQSSYSFTEPSDTPCTKYFCINGYTTRIGSTVITIAAIFSVKGCDRFCEVSICVTGDTADVSSTTSSRSTNINGHSFLSATYIIAEK